jgi:hypothetical protein
MRRYVHVRGVYGRTRTALAWQVHCAVCIMVMGAVNMRRRPGEIPKPIGEITKAVSLGRGSSWIY